MAQIKRLSNNPTSCRIYFNKSFFGKPKVLFKPVTTNYIHYTICRVRPVGHLARSVDVLTCLRHLHLVLVSRSFELTAEGRTIRPPLVLPGRFCLGRPYGRLGQPGHLKPVECVDGYCGGVGKPQPKELSWVKIKGRNRVK